MADKTHETFESQIESAFMGSVDVAYDCFMALNMDKDVLSHSNMEADTWSKLEKMVEDHKEIMAWINKENQEDNNESNKI